MNIKEVLRLHKMWLNHEPGGVRADLEGADLHGVDLRSASLSEANLNYADLCGANLNGADLSRANLRSTDLHGADLSDAKGMDIVIVDETTKGLALQCPAEGSYIGYKKAQGLIVELEILANAKRSSATARKCRASAAKVLSITNIDGTDAGVTEVASDYDSSFIYRVGEIVSVPDFDDNRWNECAPGIHHFLDRKDTVNY